MKSKLVILSLLMTGAAVTATAQTKEKFYSEKFGDNLYISVGGGVFANMSNDNLDNFGKAIKPQVTLSLGKWFTPVWGLRGQAAGWMSALNTDYNNGSIRNNADGTTTKVYDGDVVKYEKNYISTHFDAIFNLSNLFAGYNPDRLFSFSVFAGPGFTFAKGYEGAAVESLVNNGTRWQRTVNGDGDLKAYINGSVGLMGQFNVSRYFDINIEARGTLSPSIYSKINNSQTDGSVAVTAGVSYTFGGKKFVSCGEKVDVNAINQEINRYRNALAEAEAELAAAKNALANVQPQRVEVVKEIEVAGPRAIFFQIGKSVIDDYGKVNIQLAAKIIKNNPDKKYKVAGYADKATGSASWNQKLSERRAQAVYDALISEGVSAQQLELVGFGGTANMFGQNKLNRVVILE